MAGLRSIIDAEIDEAEEEALLKSDDDTSQNPSKHQIIAPAADEDSLMNENAAQLEAADEEAPPSNKTTGSGADDDEIVEDDEDDDDDDEEKPDKAASEFKQLLNELVQHPFAYEKYMRLCELSHATDDLDNIRTAYDRFAQVYPLAPELWLKYLGIEVNVALSATEVANVVALFRRALTDYYSMEIALEFAALASRTAEPERIWSELLDTYGPHCLQGRELFQRYRQFIAGNACLSDAGKRAACEQSYCQELQYPLQDMEESYIEFKVYYEKQKAAAKTTQPPPPIDWALLDKAYYKAKEQRQQIVLPHEEELRQLGASCYRERAAVYDRYIAAAIAAGLDDRLLRTLHERMVADCCLNPDCWLRYVSYLDERNENDGDDAGDDQRQEAVTLSARALRNCTWSEALYIQRIRLLERRQRPRDAVQEVLESALIAGFQTAEPAVAIWLEYLTYLRRHTDWTDDGECDILRKNFNLGWTILGQQWGVLADCNCEILQFWGRLEYGPLRDAKRGQELWSTVMASADNAVKSGLWIEFAQLELGRDLEATRRLYRKALQQPALDNASLLAAVWERFERCNGTVKSLAACLLECAPFRGASAASHAQPTGAAATLDRTTTTTAQRLPSKSFKRKTSATDTADSGAQQHKLSKTERPAPRGNDVKASADGRAYKQHESEAIDMAKDHLRIFLSNLDYGLTEADVRTSLPELAIERVDLVRSGNGRSRGFGYLELANAAEVTKALAMDRRNLHGRPLFVSSVLRDKEQRQKFKFSAGLEPQKLFVKGLPADTTKEELQQLFGAFGTLRDVRLVHHKSGKFKNIAYVEFNEEAAARKALQLLDDSELRGQRISVAISAPPPKPNANATSVAVQSANKRPSKGGDAQQQQRPRMSLIPSAVRKQFSAQPIPSNGAINASTATSSKSNADFRRLLLEKK